MKEKNYGFIIDTNVYSGNFEREMCAYITGIADNRGDEYVDQNKDPIDFEDLIGSGPDTDGELCLVTIYPTPGYWNDGNGNEYKDGEGPMPKNRKYPSYQSVLIYLSEHPDEEIISYMKEKAYEFAKIYDPCYGEKENIQILGFRLWESITEEKTVEI